MRQHLVQGATLHCCSGSASRFRTPGHTATASSRLKECIPGGALAGCSRSQLHTQKCDVPKPHERQHACAAYFSAKPSTKAASTASLTFQHWLSFTAKTEKTPGLCTCEKEERDRPKHLQRHPCNATRTCPVNPCLHNGHWNVNNVGRVPGRPRERP